MFHQNQPPQKRFCSVVLVIRLRTSLNREGETRGAREVNSLRLVNIVPVCQPFRLSGQSYLSTPLYLQ